MVKRFMCVYFERWPAIRPIRIVPVMVLTLWTILPSYGQFSLNEYLGKAREDIRMYENLEKSLFLENNPYRSPLLHRLEFRTRSNDFNFSQDDFRFRINPTNPFEIRANKKYYEMESGLLLVEYQFALNKAMYDRYRQVISLFQLEDEIFFQEREILLQRDQLRILEADLNETGFELSEYIRQKENLVNLVMDLNELRHLHEKVLHEIRSEYPFTGAVKDGSYAFITYEQIKKLVDLRTSQSDTIRNIHIDNLNRQASINEQRILVEKAEGRRNFGFIQAEYDRDRGDDFDQHMGYQIGFRIPLTNPDRPDLNRRKLELVEDKADIAREKTELEVQCDLLKMDLAFLFNQNDLITEAVSNDTLLRLLNRDANLRASDMLEAQKSILKMRKYEKLIRWDIYLSFIEYLYLSGKLIDMPLKNYLSEQLDEI